MKRNLLFIVLILTMHGIDAGNSIADETLSTINCVRNTPGNPILHQPLNIKDAIIAVGLTFPVALALTEDPENVKNIPYIGSYLYQYKEHLKTIQARTMLTLKSVGCIVGLVCGMALREPKLLLGTPYVLACSLKEQEKEELRKLRKFVVKKSDSFDRLLNNKVDKLSTIQKKT